MNKEKFDVAIIGSGPGGYVAAIRAAQRGQKTCLIEAKEMGGTCLNRGCIPSKALIANAERLREVQSAETHGIYTGDVSFDFAKMAAQKDKTVNRIRRGLTGLIASNKIKVIQGFGKFISPHEIKILGQEDLVVEAEQIIIATGSEPRLLPSAPFDYKRIHDSTSLLALTELPKSLLVVGGGVIGCEFACMHHAFGVDVTIVELLPRIVPMESEHISETLEAALKKRSMKIRTSCVVDRVEATDHGVIAHLANGETIEAEMAVVSVGRKFNTDQIGLEKAGVIVEPNGSIQTNNKMQTNIPHIYAIGDITAKWILAHVASHQGLIAADNASGHAHEINYRAVPSVIFTHPEIATVGFSLDEAIAEGYDATIGQFPFQALGKAQATGHTEGFAQMVTSKSTGQILGAQVVGYGAATLIAEITLAIENELTAESVNATIHAHPTIAEAWMEAAFSAEGLPLHLPPQAGSLANAK